MHRNIEAMLRGGDRRSIGRADEVVTFVLQSREHLPELVRCLWSEDVVVQVRAADALEKVSKTAPEAISRFKNELLGLAVETQQKELRWHFAQILPRLILSPTERARAVDLLRCYLEDSSSIVRTMALQALTEFAQHQPDLRHSVLSLLEEAASSGTPAMRARARKLLKSSPPTSARKVGRS